MGDLSHPPTWFSIQETSSHPRHIPGESSGLGAWPCTESRSPHPPTYSLPLPMAPSPACSRGPAAAPHSSPDVAPTTPQPTGGSMWGSTDGGNRRAA